MFTSSTQLMQIVLLCEGKIDGDYFHTDAWNPPVISSYGIWLNSRELTLLSAGYGMLAVTILKTSLED